MNSETKLMQEVANLNPDLISYERKIKRIHTLVHGMIGGNINGLVISGSPGVGKTHNVEEALGMYGDKINIVTAKGHITPFSTYNVLQTNCNKNDVIVFDDADSCFTEQGALNLLKAAADTKSVRVVSWLSSANKGEQSFVFEGKVIILTNVSMRKSPHYKAMLDRMHCYDLDITLAEKLQKIKYLAYSNDSIPLEVGDKTVKFLFDNQERLSDISLRTFVKISEIVTNFGDDWEDIAEVTILDK